MTDGTPRDRRSRRIEIPGDVAAEVGVPDDLNSAVLAPYGVPDVARRRRAGLVYVAAALVTVLAIVAGLPTGMWLLVGSLFVIAAYHLVAGWHLVVREGEALEAANRATEFAVGHASAAVSFDGWRARPVWNVLVFSADDPPTMRALVRVDAIHGGVIEQYAEAVPPADGSS